MRLRPAFADSTTIRRPAIADDTVLTSQQVELVLTSDADHHISRRNSLTTQFDGDRSGIEGCTPGSSTRLIDITNE